MALLDQARTNATRTKPLGKQKVLQLHAAEYRKPGTGIAASWRENVSAARHRAAAAQIMRARTNYFCLAAGLLLGSPAGAEQWFTVASPDLNASGTRVEVDLDSVRARGSGGESVIRVTQEPVQLHDAGFRYRSFVASAQFDCHRRTITLTSATYYTEEDGKGSRLGANSSANQGGMPPALLDSIPAPARRALLKATCATTQSSAG